MPKFDIYSKRQKKLRGDVPDVFVYDAIPDKLRVQIIHILRDAIGTDEQYRNCINHGGSSFDFVRDAYKFIVEALCREHGRFGLCNHSVYPITYNTELFEFLINTNEVEFFFDATELAFRCIDNIGKDRNYLHRGLMANIISQNAVKELNERFLENGVGYQYADGKIIRVDSEFIHTEVVKNALILLHKKQYAGSQDEFLKAHEHYRNGDFKESLEECLKSFESLMKSICAKRNWPYSNKDNAKQLIDICFENRLVPEFWQSQYSALRSMLESGVPTGRNKLAAHGQGEEITVVPRHIVAYMLHMTAATIVFFAEAESNMP
jgi:hypothetical protein